MHPVEHLLYYSCATIPPLLLSVHPIHFLYTKFHADIAPIGGHDGFDDPSGNGDFHFLHHSKFECNYGVPFPINLDKLCGTWADWKTYKETGELTTGEWAKKQMHEPEEEDEKRAPLLSNSGESWSMDDIAKHCSREDCFLALYGQVFNITDFISKHPGGETILLTNAGKDVTEKFERIHASSGGFDLVEKWCPGSRVGMVKNYEGPSPPVKLAAVKYPGALMLFPLLVATLVWVHVA